MLLFNILKGWVGNDRHNSIKSYSFSFRIFYDIVKSLIYKAFLYFFELKKYGMKHFDNYFTKERA